MPQPLNLIEVSTPWGFRAFELYHGSITRLDFKVDVLAISAFVGKYEPDPGTVVRALLDDCQISVKELARAREYDLQANLGCWVARAVPNDKFERILCVEITGSQFSLSEVIQNLFITLSILEMKGVEVRTLALPVLGAGNQKLDAALVIKELLASAIKYLNHSRGLRKIMFVAYDEERASQLNRAMNETLDRVKVVLPKGELVNNIRQGILQSLERAALLMDGDAHELLNNVRRIMTPEQSRSFEIGIAARRVVEFIVADIMPQPKKFDLLGRIDNLKGCDIADWIRSYMHVLRIFGNESAHERQKTGRQPYSLSETDVVLCLFCLQRVLDFWVELKQAKSLNPG
jgi:Domain of unknown function (DUF4145)